MRFRLFFFPILFVGAVFFVALPARADTALPENIRQASVLVQCENRQGSGTIVSADGYILTNAHVVADVEGATAPKAATLCQIGIIDPATEQLRYVYYATVTRWIFEPTRNQDFAILRIDRPRSRETLPGSFPFLKVWEFSHADERMWVMGFPGGDYTVQSGFIQGFSSGFIRTTAIFHPGNSGGTAVNSEHHLIGVPTRIVTITEDGKAQEVRYELVDIRAVLQWLDTFNPLERDRFFTFADPERSRKSFAYVEQSSLECTYLARSISASTVFCLLPGDERMAFPNEATFRSWYPDFQGVAAVPDESLAGFQLKRNVTYRPGTLVKSQTSLEVYVVADAFGTIRWIPNEQTAIDLWGSNWASLVHDISDGFFANYTIGPTIPSTTRALPTL